MVSAQCCEDKLEFLFNLLFRESSEQPFCNRCEDEPNLIISYIIIGMGLDQCVAAKKLYRLHFNFPAYPLYESLGRIFCDHRLEGEAAVTTGLYHRASFQGVKGYKDCPFRYWMQDVCLYFIERY